MSGCSSQGATDNATDNGPPSLILITIDTLRADHLPTYGYFRNTAPAIDAFAKNAVVYENVVAPMATTLPSHTALMTSAYPVRHGVLSNLRFFRLPVTTDGDLSTAAQMLGEVGYSTAAFTSSSPLSEATGIQAGFQTFVGPPPYGTEDRRIDIPAGETMAKALAWLRDAEPPFFLWVHLFDPHIPYAPPDDFARIFDANAAGMVPVLDRRGIAADKRKPARRAIYLYDGEIRYTDSEIGKLLDALHRRRLDDQAAIVITADHGEGLFQHGVLQHGVIWNEQIKIPLIIRYPDGRTGRRDDLVSTIDILPTLAGQTALPLAVEGFDGIDVEVTSRESVLSQRELRSGNWAAENFALTTEDWKYVYFGDRQDRLFHLAEDPHETRDVIMEHPERARALRRELLELVKANKARTPLRVTEDIPDDIREQLRALGYID